MATVTVVGGLPGSGKTTYLKHLKEQNPSLQMAGSDYKKDSIGHRPEMIYSKHHDWLIENLKAGRDCAISDIVFTQKEKQDEFEELIRGLVPGVTIEWVLFENSPLQCIRNCKARANGNMERLGQNVHYLLDLTDGYYFRPGATIRPVYKPT